MNITVIGAGHVGLIVSVGFSIKGHHVTCLDKDVTRIEKLKKGELPLYEPKLDEFVRVCQKKQMLDFTSDYRVALKKCDVCFVTVGTPMNKQGHLSIEYLDHVIESTLECATNSTLLVIKSTVPVGTTRRIREYIKDKTSNTISVVVNPEFISEGNGCNDFLQPDRVVIGTDDEEHYFRLRQVYETILPVNTPYFFMSFESAELAKYASNCMLATRISFINEIALLCEAFNADIKKVQVAVGADKRIGQSYLSSGCGYGGSCLPKDVKSLLGQAESVGIDTCLIRAVNQVNECQKKVIVKKVCGIFGNDLRNKIFSIWGLSFKAHTDDVRESVAITIIDELRKKGARLYVYDPKVKDVLLDQEGVQFFYEQYMTLNNSDGLIVLTDWEEFINPDFELMGRKMNRKIIFDGRNVYDREAVEKNGFKCIQIGVKG